MSYRDVVHSDYSALANLVGTQFIVKPTNASASRSAFKVQSEEEFELIKGKISR